MMQRFNDTAKYIKKFFKATAFQEIPLMSYNVTKRMIDKMSRIYTLGASRTLPKKQEEYDSLVRYKDFKMKHIEKMTKLVGTIAVQVSWKQNGNGLHYFKYTPFYKFDVILNPNNPLEPIGLIYPMMMPSDDSTVAPDPLYCYWDSKFKIIYDGEMNELERYKNPYGRNRPQQLKKRTNSKKIFFFLIIFKITLALPLGMISTEFEHISSSLKTIQEQLMNEQADLVELLKSLFLECHKSITNDVRQMHAEMEYSIKIILIPI